MGVMADALPGIVKRSKERAWTEAELDAIRRMHAEGRTHAEMAAALPGRTVGGVRKRHSALGLTRRPGGRPSPDGTTARRWSPEEDDALRKALAAGEQVKAIAARLGRSPGAVGNRALRLGLTRDVRRREQTRPGVNARIVHYADQVAEHYRRGGENPAEEIQYVPWE